MWDGFNQRKFPRLNLKCEVSLNPDQGGKAIKAVTDNVGLGGVCLMQPEPLERFTQCHVRLQLEDKKSEIECDGKVCWIIPKKDPRSKEPVKYDTGIEFLNIRTEDQARLKQFLRDKMPKGFEEIA